MDLYQQQLKEKAEQLKFWLIPFYQGAIEVFPSASKHYRMRAEFSILHEGDKAFYAMHQGPNKTLEKINIYVCVYYIKCISYNKVGKTYE